MSLIFPKKEILYAPMLGTLGGGSARGMGRGLGRGLVLYRILMMGGGGGKSNNYDGTGGAAGLALFELELPKGTQITTTAGGKGRSEGGYGGGGGHTRLQIPSLNFDAVVGGGGGSGYVDMGGLGGGVGINGTHGYDYPGQAMVTSGDAVDDGYGSGYGGSQTAGGTRGKRSDNTAQGQNGGSFYGGVYPYPGDSYPGGGGGSGYYGGGSGSGNNGQGGGPGGGGSGYISVGDASGYNLLLNSAHQTLNINMFSIDPVYFHNQNISMNHQYGSVDYRFPPSYTTSSSADYYHQSHWHRQISGTDSNFAAYATFGCGGRESRNSNATAGVVVFRDSAGEVHVNVGSNNSATSSTDGNVVVTTTL